MMHLVVARPARVLITEWSGRRQRCAVACWLLPSNTGCGALPALARGRRRERTPPCGAPRTPCHRRWGLEQQAPRPSCGDARPPRCAAPSACPYRYQRDRDRKSGRQPARPPRAAAARAPSQVPARGRAVSCRVAPFQGTLRHLRVRERCVASHEHRRPDGRPAPGIDHCVSQSTVLPQSQNKCSSRISRSQQILSLTVYIKNNISICVSKQVCHENV